MARSEGPCANYRVDLSAAQFATCVCGYRRDEHDWGGGRDLAQEARSSLRPTPSEPTAASPPAADDTGRSAAASETSSGHPERDTYRLSTHIDPAPAAARGSPQDVSPRTADLEGEHQRLKRYAAQLKAGRESCQELRDEIEMVKHEIGQAKGVDVQVSHLGP